MPPFGKTAETPFLTCPNVYTGVAACRRLERMWSRAGRRDARREPGGGVTVRRCSRQAAGEDAEQG
jgi:hypothetical protein